MRFYLLALLGLLSSCASMVAHFCSEEMAYEHGFNQAKNGEDRNIGQYGICESSDQKMLMDQYAQGYLDGAQVAVPRAQHRLGPHRLSKNSHPSQECLSSYGQRACGYNCVASYDEVKCAQVPEHNCVAAYGKIRCGSNCREEFGQIRCR